MVSRTFKVACLASVTFCGILSRPCLAISLDLHYASPKDICAKLSAESRVALFASPELANRKITVLCTNQPLKGIKQELASVLHASWRANEKGEILVPTHPDRTIVRDKSTSKWIINTLKYLAWCKDMPAEYIQRLAAGTIVYNGPKDIDTSTFDYKYAADQTDLFALAKQLLEHTGWLQELERYIPIAIEMPKSIYLMRITDGKTLQFCKLVSSSSQNGDLIPIHYLIKKLDPGSKSATQGTSDLPDGMFHQAPNTLTNSPSSPYFSKAFGLDDVATHIAAISSSPVIAEVFRSAVATSIPIIDTTVGDLVKSLFIQSHQKLLEPFSVDVGPAQWIHLTYDNAADLRDTEVSEATLSVPEIGWKSGKQLTLDMYTSIATKTSPKSQFFFARPNLVVSFPFSPLRSHYQLLLLLGSLSKSQQEKTLDGSLSYGELFTNQKALYKSAFVSALFNSVIYDESVTDFLFTSKESSANLKFISRPAPGTIPNNEIIQPIGTEFSQRAPFQLVGGILFQATFSLDGKPGLLTAFRIPEREVTESH